MDHAEFRSFDFDIEPFFDEFVVSVGGELIRELVGPSPGFANADYLFRDERVVLELKCLENDYLAFGGMMNRFNKAAGKAIGIGEIVDAGNYQIPNTPKFQSDLRGVVEEPIRRILKKANKQLRETVEHFEMPDAFRVTLVNNDGLLSLGTEEAMGTIASILSREFSNTDAFVYFTTNYWSRGEGDEPVQIWAPSSNDYVFNSLNPFLCDLGEKWFEFFGKQIGGWAGPIRRERAVDWTTHYKMEANSDAVGFVSHLRRILSR